MSFVKYSHALKWEFSQNLPMILGFLVASWLRPVNLAGALVILAVGIAGGVVIMHYTEPKLHKTPIPVSWKYDFYNFLLFMLFAIPFMFYYSVSHPLLTWQTDLIIGAVVGALLTWGQALAWRGNKFRMVIHGVAMAISFPIIMIGIRFLLRLSSLEMLLLWGVLLVLFASAIITLVDYTEMFAETEKVE